jgi:hypothetical protein
MDVKQQIARLRATADLLSKYPELGMEERVGQINPAANLFNGYPTHKLEDLITFLHENGILFKASTAEDQPNSVCIYVEGLCYWFSNLRIADLSISSATALFDASVDESLDRLANLVLSSLPTEAQAPTTPHANGDATEIIPAWGDNLPSPFRPDSRGPLA